MRRSGLAAGSVLALAIGLWGQGGRGGGQNPNGRGNPNQNPAAQGAPAVSLPPGSVEGRVISTKGEVLRKVSLTLRPNGRGGGNYATTSANDGSFRFASVDPGNYALIGERTGYVRETLSSPGGQVRVIEVVSEKSTGGIELKLTPQSVIAGHIFDEDGDPLQSAIVEVWRNTYPRGRRQLTQVQNGSTNDLGEFRIANLAPGRYYVSATARRNGPLPGGRGGRGGAAGRGSGGGRGGPAETIEDYVTTYYPNLMEPSSASPLELVAGSEMRGIDMRLLKAQYHRVSGSVTGLPASTEQNDLRAKQKGKAGDALVLPGSMVQLTLVPRTGGARQIGNAALLADGTFEFPAVPPGSYYLNAQTPGRPQQRVTARVPVDVGNSDVSNVSLRLQPSLSVSGKVTVEGTQPNVRMGSMRLVFTTASEGAPGNPVVTEQAQLMDDGTFQTSLAPDAYIVEAGGLPDGYYLKSVRLAGREMPDATLDLGYGGGQIDVILAPSAGDLTGTVQNSHGDPAASVQVTAVPASGSLRRDMNKLVTTDANGAFTLHSLPPGEYKLFAWEEVETNAWMDRDYRQPFENASTSAKLDASTSPTVTLRLIERGAGR